MLFHGQYKTKRDDNVHFVVSVSSVLNQCQKFIVCQKTNFKQLFYDFMDQYILASQVFLCTKKVFNRGAPCHWNVMFVFQAIDDDCNQTGQMLSALLNWPQVIGLKFFKIGNIFFNPPS